MTIKPGDLSLVLIVASPKGVPLLRILISEDTEAPDDLEAGVCQVLANTSAGVDKDTTDDLVETIYEALAQVRRNRQQ